MKGRAKQHGRASMWKPRKRLETEHPEQIQMLEYASIKIELITKFKFKDFYKARIEARILES